MRRTFLIHDISTCKSWVICFRSLMAQSDTFSIIFQNQDSTAGDVGLNAGKQEFMSMPGLTVSPYEGMDDSIKVTGDLGQFARELFLNFMAPSFQGFKSDLWSFQFLKGDDVILRVEDFSVALLFLKEGERQELLAQGVAAGDLEEIDNCSL